jgi:hypothetical protein
MLGCHRFEHRPEYLRRYILRQQPPKQFIGRLLIDVIDLRGSKLCRLAINLRSIAAMHADTCLFGCFQRTLTPFNAQLFRLSNVTFSDFGNRQYPFYDKALRNHRLELVEDKIHGVYLLIFIALDHILPDLLHIFEGDFIENPYMLCRDLDLARAGVGTRIARRITAAKEIAPFAPDRLDVDSLVTNAIEESHRRLQNVRVERTSETAITGYND